MSVIVEKPYKFVPPHRGNLWPSCVQRLRIVDFYLRRKEGITQYECRHLDRLRESIDQNHGILLAPNHCRYADPLVMGWPARELRQHVYAIASWHLFNKNRFESFAIQKLGGFSLFREGQDRQSLEMAIDILVTADRPLILFPEGTTNRSNDFLQPLLEGATFVARTAARRREKAGHGKVVVHPVGIKYVFTGNIHRWADKALKKIEQRLGWTGVPRRSLMDRLSRVAHALLTLQEIEHRGPGQHSGPELTLHQRRVRLIGDLLQPLEQHYGGAGPAAGVLQRVRALRTRLLPLLQAAEDPGSKQELRRKLQQLDLAQQLESYVEGYLSQPPVTDTRILETIQRMQENFLGRADSSFPMKVIIEVDEALVVPPERPPRGQADPLLVQMDQRLRAMLQRLQYEANLFDESAKECESGC